MNGRGVTRRREMGRLYDSKLGEKLILGFSPFFKGRCPKDRGVKKEISIIYRVFISNPQMQIKFKQYNE